MLIITQNHHCYSYTETAYDLHCFGHTLLICTVSDTGYWFALSQTQITDLHCLRHRLLIWTVSDTDYWFALSQTQVTDLHFLRHRLLICTVADTDYWLHCLRHRLLICTVADTDYWFALSQTQVTDLHCLRHMLLICTVSDTDYWKQMLFGMKNVKVFCIVFKHKSNGVPVHVYCIMQRPDIPFIYVRDTVKLLQSCGVSRTVLR